MLCRNRRRLIDHRSQSSLDISVEVRTNVRRCARLLVTAATAGNRGCSAREIAFAPPSSVSADIDDPPGRIAVEETLHSPLLQ